MRSFRGIAAQMLQSRKQQFVFRAHSRGIQTPSEWWIQFKKELKEELTFIPAPKGYIDTSPFNLKLWEQIPNDHLRYAVKQALLEVFNQWRFVFSATYRAELWEEERRRKLRSAGIDPVAKEAPGSEAEAKPGGPVSSEDVRAGALHVAKRFSEAASDDDLRASIARLGTSALRTARDALDAFLVGYAEGKHKEVREWVEEETGREVDAKARITRLRAQIDVELSARQAAEGTVATATMSTEDVRAAALSAEKESSDARLTAAARAALTSMSAEPGLQTLRDVAGTIRDVAIGGKGREGGGGGGGMQQKGTIPAPARKNSKQDDDR